MTETVSRWNWSWRGHDHGQMTRQPDGQWVEYVAHAATVEALRAKLARVEALAGEFEAARDYHRTTAADTHWAEWVRDGHKARASELTGVVRELRAALKDTTP